MMAALTSEFRKLLTVRSTYIITGLAVLLVVFLAFYIEAYRGAGAPAAGMLSKTALSQLIVNIAGLVGAFGSIVVILLAAHEYRHNTIIYTLTASNSRSKVLLAKVIVSLTYGLAFLLIAGAVGVGSYLLGIALSPRDVTLPPQTIEIAVLGRLVFYVVAALLLALLLTVLIRNLVVPLLIIFMVPNTVEPLFSLLLKENAVYLPFSAMQQVLMPGQRFVGGTLSASTAMLTVAIYLVVGWAIAWWLFLRRDAN